MHFSGIDPSGGFTAAGGSGGEPLPSGKNGRASADPSYLGPSALEYNRFRQAEVIQRDALDRISDATKTTYDDMDSHVQSYYDHVAEQAEKTAAGVDYMADRMSGAIADFAASGKFSFADFTESIVNDLIRIQTRTLLTNLFSQAAASGAGGAFSFFGNAKGGAYGSMGRMAFATAASSTARPSFPLPAAWGLWAKPVRKPSYL